MQLRHLKGEQWVQMSASSPGAVQRLNRTSFALGLMRGRSADAAPRVTSCTTLRSMGWIGGTIAVVDRAPGWGLLSMDALFLSPDRLAIIPLPTGAWAATIPAPRFPFLLLVGRGSKKPPFATGTPTRGIDQAIQVMELASLDHSQWMVVPGKTTGHERALEDTVLVSGPAEFLVARRDNGDVARLRISLRSYRADVRSGFGVEQGDLLTGSLGCTPQGEGLRVRFDGLAITEFGAPSIKRLRTADASGHRAICLEGAFVNGRSFPLLVDGHPLPLTGEKSVIDWPGRYSIGLRDADLGFELSTGVK